MFLFFVFWGIQWVVLPVNFFWIFCWMVGDDGSCKSFYFYFGVYLGFCCFMTIIMFPLK
jgi:hypothetical protein